MQGKCGSETRLNEAVKGKLDARVEFQVCKACSRVSNAELFVKRVRVAEDGVSQATARQLFDTLDVETSEKLHSLCNSHY